MLNLPKLDASKIDYAYFQIILEEISDFQLTEETFLKLMNTKYQLSRYEPSVQLINLRRWFKNYSSASWEITTKDGSVFYTMPYSETELLNIQSIEICVESTCNFSCTPENMEDNYCLYIPDEIGILKNLEILSIEGARISNFEDGFMQLHNLSQLNLSSNDMIEPPKSLSSFTKLTYLNFGWSDLEVLPADIMKLTKLTFFNVCSTFVVLTEEQNQWLEYLEHYNNCEVMC